MMALCMGSAQVLPLFYLRQTHHCSAWRTEAVGAAMIR